MLQKLWLPLLLSCLAAEARERLLNDPIFLQDYQAQRLELIAQGNFFSLTEFHTRLEAATGFRYGLSKSLNFTFSMPYISESITEGTKSGQGDFATALTFHRPWFKSTQWSWGLRETLRFPSGYRESIEGFSTFTAGTTRSETLFLLELQKPKFTLDGHFGFSVDDRRAEARNIWGIGMRNKLWKEWLMLEIEIGQELNLNDKLYNYQFYTGVRSNLPFGITLKAGAEQRIFGNNDTYGIYGGLSWSFQPRIPQRIENRNLREHMRLTLERKNSVLSFSLEPGLDSESQKSSSPNGFQPIRVAVLPFLDESGYPVSQELWEQCLLHFDSDSSLSVVPRREITAALNLHKLDGRNLSPEHALNLAESVEADFLLQGRIHINQPANKTGLDLSPLLTRTHLESQLQALVTLTQVSDGSVQFKGLISSQARSDSQLRLFHLKADHRDTVFRASSRQELLRRTIEQWAGKALDEMFYEYSVQLVLK